jgi:hypothetical protein
MIPQASQYALAQDLYGLGIGIRDFVGRQHSLSDLSRRHGLLCCPEHVHRLPISFLYNVPRLNQGLAVRRLMAIRARL